MKIKDTRALSLFYVKKENGQWNTSHRLTQHAIYQFGSSIYSHLAALEMTELKKLAA